MKLGFIGLGKMGLPMVGRLVKGGHEVIVFDSNPEAVQAATQVGAEAASDVESMVRSLGQSPTIWMMIPSNLVDEQLKSLLGLMNDGIIIDGGNSNFNKTLARAKQASEYGVELIDVGTSGGVLGGDAGYALMIGGNDAAVKRVWPLFEALGIEGGFNHVGGSGAGHYVKMVHNAIEYGMMQSYAEGYQLLREGPIKGLDLGAIGEQWQHGSIVVSLLNQLTAEALQENPELKGIDGYVAESGEARWALETGKQSGVEMPAIQASLDVRIESQKGKTSFATKLLAAMRNKFGGHAINK